MRAKSLLLYVFILYVKAFSKSKDFMSIYYIYYNIYNILNIIYNILNIIYIIIPSSCCFSIKKGLNVKT